MPGESSQIQIVKIIYSEFPNKFKILNRIYLISAIRPDINAYNLFLFGWVYLGFVVPVLNQLGMFIT